MMKSISTWKQELTEGAHAARLAALYCCTPTRPLHRQPVIRLFWTGWRPPLAHIPRPVCIAPPAAPRSAATTPTTSMAACWQAA